MVARKLVSPEHEILASAGLPTGLVLHRLTSHKQACGPAWRELMDMPYLSTKIMREYLRTFKQGWRTGAVAYVTRQGSIVAMGLRVTVKPIHMDCGSHVVAFYVMPAFRREGLGKKLYAVLRDAAPGDHNPWYFSHDEPSSGFYTALGVQKPEHAFKDVTP